MQGTAECNTLRREEVMLRLREEQIFEAVARPADGGKSSEQKNKYHSITPRGPVWGTIGPTPIVGKFQSATPQFELRER